mgnify:CR=1 FL=1
MRIGFLTRRLVRTTFQATIHSVRPIILRGQAGGSLPSADAFHLAGGLRAGRTRCDHQASGKWRWCSAGAADGNTSGMARRYKRSISDSTPSTVISSSYTGLDRALPNRCGYWPNLLVTKLRPVLNKSTNQHHLVNQARRWWISKTLFDANDLPGT